MFSTDWRDGSEEPTFQRRPNAKEPLNIWSSDQLIIWSTDYDQIDINHSTQEIGDKNQTIGTLMRPQGICQMTEIHQLETKSFIFLKKVISKENILVVNIINARNISSDFTGIKTYCIKAFPHHIVNWHYLSIHIVYFLEVGNIIHIWSHSVF